MRINSTTRILGKAVLLVPYRVEHVENWIRSQYDFASVAKIKGQMLVSPIGSSARYHLWMKSPELRHLTGSEPLTLEEEYAMQKSWRDDEDKCTFIVLDRTLFEKSGQETESMIGDTNLYFNDTDEPHTAECEIMIAEELHRERGMGSEAMILMFRYGIDLLKVEKYRAKIKLHNARSIRMFAKLGFKEVSRSEVFEEITMEKNVGDDWIESLALKTPAYCRYECELSA